MKLLAKRNNVFIVEENGQVKTIISDKYTELKLEKYDGNRIFYDFGDGLRVQETYDERIFNCYKNDIVINIRDGKIIAELILDNNKDGYDKYFKEHYYEQHRTELLDRIVGSYGDRVTKIKDGYIIDSIWKVNNQGSSYYFSSSHDGKYDNVEHVRVHGENAKGKTGDWHFLCTVAKGNVMKMSMDSEAGILELDETTMTILAKINFLMNPNISDDVFMNQLPEDLKKVLTDESIDKNKGGILK